MEDDIACTLDQLPPGPQVGKVVVVGFSHGKSHDIRSHHGPAMVSPYHEFRFMVGNTIYMPCFFWNSRSSFHRVLTPSIMTWTSWTSEYPVCACWRCHKCGQSGRRT